MFSAGAADLWGGPSGGAGWGNRLGDRGVGSPRGTGDGRQRGLKDVGGQSAGCRSAELRRS